MLFQLFEVFSSLFLLFPYFSWMNGILQVHNNEFDCWLCRGYKRFFKRTALETSDYLKDDCLSVHCSVGLVRSHTEGPKIYSIAVPPSNIGQHFGQLLESGKGTDVNFEVDGETFSAHKLVLAARSPVFRAQLFGPMRDQNTQCIKVEDMEAPVFKVWPFYLLFYFWFCSTTYGWVLFLLLQFFCGSYGWFIIFKLFFTAPFMALSFSFYFDWYDSPPFLWSLCLNNLFYR